MPITAIRRRVPALNGRQRQEHLLAIIEMALELVSEEDLDEEQQQGNPTNHPFNGHGSFTEDSDDSFNGDSSFSSLG